MSRSTAAYIETYMSRSRAANLETDMSRSTVANVETNPSKSTAANIKTYTSRSAAVNIITLAKNPNREQWFSLGVWYSYSYSRVKGGEPCSPRFARRPLPVWSSCLCLWLCLFVSQVRHLARLVSLASFPSPRSASAFSVEFIIVFVVAFIFASQVRRLASLASLTSLGARFHCGVHVCVCGCVCVRCGSASLALLCSLRAAPAFIVGKKE